MKKFTAIAATILAVGIPFGSMAENRYGDDITRSRSEHSEAASNPFLAILDAMQKSGEPAKPFAYSREWVDAQPTPEGDEQWACLSEALYFEARGESVRGQFAVGEVILNRVDSGRFPDTLCGVIKQGTGRKYQCQFTYTCDGYKDVIAEKQAYERVSKVARALIDGVSDGLTGGATHYHTTAVRPSWSKVYTKTAAIGVHVFYRHNYRTASN